MTYQFNHNINVSVLCTQCPICNMICNRGVDTEKLGFQQFYLYKFVLIYMIPAQLKLSCLLNAETSLCTNFRD